MMPSEAIVDLASRMSDLCFSLAMKTNIRFRIENSELSLDEVCAIDGMLPVFLSQAVALYPRDGVLHIGYFIEKKALMEACPVVLAPLNDKSIEGTWLDLLKSVMRDMEMRAATNAGIVALDADYGTWLGELQSGKLASENSKDEIIRRLRSDIYQDSTEERTTSMPPTSTTNDLAESIRVSRQEIAQYLVAPIAEELNKLRENRGRPFFILVHHPFGEFESDLVKALETQVFMAANGATTDQRDLVAAATDLIPLSPGKSPTIRSEALIDCLASGNNVIAVAVAPSKLPTDVRELIEVSLEINRFDEKSLSTALQLFYGLDSAPAIIDGPWLPLVRPKDFLVNPYGGSDVAMEIQKSVERRLSNVGTDNSLSLDEISGMPEAKEWATQLIADLRLAEKGPDEGGIDWSDVDKGALFEGPPGVGKTSIARAIAKASGLKFVVASATSWQAAGSLDMHLQAMRESFASAAEYSPAILFIDEIDSIGNRERLSGDNMQYQTEVVNALLQELDGFEGRQRVIVLAATNRAENVDPALQRAGRLDRVIRIPYPNVAGLKGIYQYHLRHVSHCLGDEEVETVASASLGLTGADVELFIRGAKRSARRSGRLEVSTKDILEQVYKTPPENQRQPLREQDIRQTAVHESGHALMQLLGPDQGESLNYVSVIPRSDGTLGFVASSSEQYSLHATPESVLHRVRTLLGGRASEEIYFGNEGVTNGAGGTTPKCDLAQATRVVEYLLTKQGMGSDSGLLWRQAGIDDDLDLKARADRLLGEQYALTRQMLEDNRDKLDRIVSMLMERHEVEGSELRKAFQTNTT
jgi:ATP-dependent Zn protease